MLMLYPYFLLIIYGRDLEKKANIKNVQTTNRISRKCTMEKRKHFLKKDLAEKKNEIYMKSRIAKREKGFV